MGHTVVIDYRKGNLRSVERALVDAGLDARISGEAAAIRDASALVLPGVGSFADAMAELEGTGQADALLERLEAGLPFLGICLGMQLLFERGSEGAEEGFWTEGLGLLKGSCTRLESEVLKVPHVGWDQVELTDHGRSCPALAKLSDGANFYFTHSFACADDVDEAAVCGITDYTRRFASIVWQDNLLGCQFHPEKSSRAGAAILEGFAAMAKGRA